MIWAAVFKPVVDILTAIGFELHQSAAAFAGFLAYEGLRVWKRGGFKRALRGVGWWYTVIFIINGIVAAFVASVSAAGNLWLAGWLGFSVPSATGILVQPRRPTRQVDIDDVSISGTGSKPPTFLSAVQAYYKGMSW